MSSLSSSLVCKIVFKNLSEIIPKYTKGRLLDIGCSDKPYKSLTTPYVTEHIGLDHAQSPHELQDVDIIADAYNTTLDDASFDTVLSTAVLEHLEEPEKALREAYRVLKPAGHAIYTIPLFWHLHEEPRDFYRYTKHGIRYLFEKVGFEIVELRPLSGFWITFGTEFNYYINRFNRGILRPFITFWIAINNIIFLLLEKLDSPKEWTWMYLVVGRKGSNK